MSAKGNGQIWRKWKDEGLERLIGSVSLGEYLITFCRTVAHDQLQIQAEGKNLQSVFLLFFFFGWGGGGLLMKQMPVFIQCINAAAEVADVRQEAPEQQQEIRNQPDTRDAAGIGEGGCQALQSEQSSSERHKLGFQPVTQTLQ